MRDWSWILVLFGGLLFSSCDERPVPLPKEGITEEQMVAVLIDIHIIEGARNGALILGDTNKIEDYYAKIYDKHGIEEDAFKITFHFLSQHPKQFIPIYEQVLDSLKISGQLLAKEGVELDYD